MVYQKRLQCDITFSGLNVLIGENGTGKTNILDAVNYFYRNLTDSNISTDIFDENNHYSNEVRISLTYDLSEFVKISKSNADTVPDFEKEEAKEKGRYVLRLFEDNFFELYSLIERLCGMINE